MNWFFRIIAWFGQRRGRKLAKEREIEIDKKIRAYEIALEKEKLQDIEDKKKESDKAKIELMKAIKEEDERAMKLGLPPINWAKHFETPREVPKGFLLREIERGYTRQQREMEIAERQRQLEVQHLMMMNSAAIRNPLRTFNIDI